MNAKRMRLAKRRSTPLRRISDLDHGDPGCATCGGEGWVCENHPEKAWGMGLDCPCGGAGEPCKCNPLHQSDER